MTDLHSDSFDVDGGGRVAITVALMALAALALIAGASYTAGQRSVDIQAERRRADGAVKRETEAKVAAEASGKLADERLREVERLRRDLAGRPTPPPSTPVPPDASAQVVVSGLRGLGVRPVLLGEDPALGLNLPDGRQVLAWGREAQRVPPLVARLETLEQLAATQEGATGALLQQRARLEAALRASDEAREAERNVARMKLDARTWSVGFLAGVDPSGARRLGAYASKAWGPVQVQVVVLGNQAAIGGGLRF